MALVRVLEPEVMDTEQEASDYDAMDHTLVNASFCDDLLGLALRPGRVIDFGTGTALIPIELCRRTADASVCALDAAESMLALALRNVERAGLASRVRLVRADARATGWPGGSFDAAVSNSLVHHIPRPAVVLREMWRVLRPGGVLFVRDLARPESEERVEELVATYAPIPSNAQEPVRDMHSRQRALFAASLRAALTTEEVADLAGSLGIAAGAVRRTSDRHWTLAGVKTG